MLKNILILIIPIILLSFGLKAQEFNCSISVTSSEVQGTDRSVYNTMQRALYEFVNQKKWTNYVIGIQERIECTMRITIKERVSSDEFKAQINVQLRRPIYRTSYNSVQLNHLDKDFTFQYIESQPLEYQDNAYSSNLTSVIAFYCYIILGMDFDSYAQFGGTPFFEKAQAVVNAAQNAPERGWKAYESLKNRYWIAENLLNASYAPMREFTYQFHRKGLDVMSDNVEMGRSEITNSLELLRKSSREKPDLYLLRMVMDAKSDEFVNIYTTASPMDKTKAMNILIEIDPANGTKYQKIQQK